LRLRQQLETRSEIDDGWILEDLPDGRSSPLSQLEADCVPEPICGDTALSWSDGWIPDDESEGFSPLELRFFLAGEALADDIEQDDELARVSSAPRRAAPEPPGLPRAEAGEAVAWVLRWVEALEKRRRAAPEVRAVGSTPPPIDPIVAVSRPPNPHRKTESVLRTLRIGAVALGTVAVALLVVAGVLSGIEPTRGSTLTPLPGAIDDGVDGDATAEAGDAQPDAVNEEATAENIDPEATGEVLLSRAQSCFSARRAKTRLGFTAAVLFGAGDGASQRVYLGPGPRKAERRCLERTLTGVAAGRTERDLVVEYQFQIGPRSAVTATVVSSAPGSSGIPHQLRQLNSREEIETLPIQ